MARYEMLWDCPRCDTKGLLGLSHRHCPSCGAAQDPTRRYFPPEDQKVAVEDHPFHGADKACPACESPNARVATHCVNCGSPLDGAAEVKRVGEGAATAAPATGGPATAAPATGGPATAAPATGGPATRGRRWWPWLLGLGVLGGLLVLVCVGLVGFEAFGGKAATLAVVGRTWERTVEVEQFRTVSGSDWRDGVPAGARNVRCQREQRSTNRVADGQDCHTVKKDHGDGTYSEEQACTTRYREEPVYDERCAYEVDRWQTQRTERAAGTNEPPTWPSPPVGGAGLGATRLGHRAATYGVTLSDGTQQWPCTVEEARWNELSMGSLWVTTLGGLTGRPDCDALQRPG